MQTVQQNRPENINQILERAAELIFEKYTRQGRFESPVAVKEYLKLKMGQHDREVFALMMLDSQHRMICFEILFYGTINSASVYPREVVKAALRANAAAVILTHNHPSGVTEPSRADKLITHKLVNALDLIDVRVLDHVIVGETTLSFAEHNLLPVPSTPINT